MKRFTILLTSLIGVLAFSAILQAQADARVEEKKTSAPVQVYDSTGAMLEAINAKPAEKSVVNVYDATGAMLEAINPAKKTTYSPVYDATGAMLDAINPKAVEGNTFPPNVYDATGAMLEAIQP